MPTAGSSNLCSLLAHKLALSQPPLRCQCSPPLPLHSVSAGVMLYVTLPHYGWGSSPSLSAYSVRRSCSPPRLPLSWEYRVSLVYTWTRTVLALLANAILSRLLCLLPWEYFPLGYTPLSFWSLQSRVSFMILPIRSH